MVEVTVFKNSLEEVVRLQVEGHAGYADSGQDIVCSAVSVLTINTVNSIMHILGVKLEPKSELGILTCQFPNQDDDQLQEKMQLLLQSMVLGLRSIEDNYRDFIRLSMKYV